jgi:Uncharacterized conserved protein
MTHTNAAVGGHFTWLGIALIVLGVVAILTPAAAGGAVVIVIGLILLGAGVAAAIRGLQAATGMEKVLGLVVGVVTALAGVAVLARPLFGLGLLTLLLAGYFMVDGVGKIIVSFRFRPAEGWLWLLFSGGVSLLLGVLLWSQWPMSGLWAVGVLVGLNLMSTGFALLKSASMLRAARVHVRNANALNLPVAALFACLLACLVPHEQAVAAQSARSIIPQLQEQFGLNETQVRGALGALLVFARERLPKPEFDELAQRIPNAEQAMQQVKLQGIVTGPLDNIGEYEAALSSLGIGQPLASQFAPAVLNYLGAAGYQRERDMLARVLN